jgi:hypothetical protein
LISFSLFFRLRFSLSGSCGEGGAIFTPDDDLVEHMHQIRIHAWLCDTLKSRNIPSVAYYTAALCRELPTWANSSAISLYQHTRQPTA